MLLWLVFDLLLIGAIVWLAWAALAAADGFKMIVLFMVLGLFVALAWVRLHAPDVALAEAAVGSGVTGALLLKTLRHRRARGGGEAQVEAQVEAGAPRALGLAVLALATVLTGLLAAVLLLIPRPAPSLAETVFANLEASGVANPVTAVLLNFRAYDTLLEVVVLFAVVLVVWLLGDAEAERRAPRLGPIFLGFARLALPAMVLISGYLLWLGGFAPGGAFQAGAVLGAVGIVLLLGRLYTPSAADRLPARLLFGLGTAGFAGAGLSTLALGNAFLGYPPEEAKTWILVIEALLTVSIAATLAGLFFGAAPSGGLSRGRAR
jgi:multisubunit Na+/H+ antiporter MnhB subunit